MTFEAAHYPVSECLLAVPNPSYQVLATYLILVCAGGTLLSVVVSFLFNFGYLLVGMIAFSIDNNPLVI